MSLQLVAGPTIEPVDLVAAKAHLRVDFDDDDGLISALIVAAREQAEVETNRALLTQTWRLVLDRFPPANGPIVVPRPPLQQVVSITYVDASGATGTVDPATYVVDEAAEPARIRPAWSRFWPPVILQTAAAVRVEYVAGWQTPADVPQRIKQAILLMVGHWYENRESVVVGSTLTEVPQAVKALLWGAWTPPASTLVEV